MKMIARIALLLSTIFLMFSLISATGCSKPDDREEIFVLSEDRSSYAEGFVLQIVCVPGYNPEIAFDLICDKSGQWAGEFPQCEKAEDHLRWWILLIVVVIVVVGMPCSVPRVYFHFYDERHVVRQKALQQGNSAYHRTNDSNEVLEMKMNQSPAAVGSPMNGTGGADSLEPHFPKPLPPIKTSKERINACSIGTDESVMTPSSPARLPALHQRSSTTEKEQ